VKTYLCPSGFSVDRLHDKVVATGIEASGEMEVPIPWSVIAHEDDSTGRILESGAAVDHSERCDFDEVVSGDRDLDAGRELEVAFDAGNQGVRDYRNGVVDPVVDARAGSLDTVAVCGELLRPPARGGDFDCGSGSILGQQLALHVV
jgi:hypothetical protein